MAGDDLAAVVSERFLAWVAEHSPALRIDPDELSLRIGVHENGRLIQIHGAREVGGIPVRGAGVGASLKAGNLVLFGADKWGDLDLDLQPALSAAAAREVTGTTFSDTGLQNGREYYYVVAGFNASDSCMGPASPCTPVTADGSTIFTDGFESGDTSLWDAR